MLGKVFTNLLRSEGIRSTALVTVGNTVSTGLGAVAMILVFRLLTPSDFGIFSAIFAMMMVIVKLADMGSNIALQRTLAQPSTHTSNSEKASFWKLTFIFKLTIGAITILLGSIFAGFFSHLLHLDSVYISAGLISAFGMIIYDQAVISAQAMHKFGISVGVSALQSVFKIIGVIALLYFGIKDPRIIIYLYGLAPLVGALFVPLFVEIPVGKLNIGDSSQLLWSIAKWTSLAVISAALADNLDVLMIQSMLSSEGTGLYSAAARIASFVAIVSYAIGVVLNVRVAKYKTQEHIDKYLKKAKKLATISLVAMMLSAPLASLMIYFTAGSPYLSATPALVYLLIATGFMMATSPFVALFYTFDKPQYFAYSGILVVILLVVGNWLLIPRLGIVGAGIAKLITRILLFFYTYYYARRAYEENFA